MFDEHTPLVIVGTFVRMADAEVAASALRAADIPVFVRRDDCGGIRPSLWLSGIDVIVRAGDEAAARNVLEGRTTSLVVP